MQQTPKFDAVSDARKFFVDHKGDDGKVDGKMMVNLRTAAVVVTTAFGDKVAFTKFTHPNVDPSESSRS